MYNDNNTYNIMSDDDYVGMDWITIKTWLYWVNGSRAIVRVNHRPSICRLGIDDGGVRGTNPDRRTSYNVGYPVSVHPISAQPRWVRVICVLHARTNVSSAIPLRPSVVTNATYIQIHYDIHRVFIADFSKKIVLLFIT